MRSILNIVKAEKVNMGGIILEQALPVMDIEQIDPFLLIHHWNQHYDDGYSQKDLGVGPHPHRGFSPVTFIFKGGLQHRDSRGNNSVIYAGGTQWINSGMGLIHSERPAREIAEEGGDLELIQFWINLPAKYKMNQPAYLPLPAENTPVFESIDKKVTIRIIAGEYAGIEGGIKSLTPLLILRLSLMPDGKVVIPVPKSYNSLLYLLDGSVQLEDKEVFGKEMIQFGNDGGDIEVHARGHTRAILLAGQPLNEPVAANGPFVMNTDTEILEAMRDYRMGKMGVLIEEFN